MGFSVFGTPLDDSINGGYLDVYSHVVSVVLVLWELVLSQGMGMEIRNKRHVTLLQESEISAGRHSRNLILVINCCRISQVTKRRWLRG